MKARRKRELRTPVRVTARFVGDKGWENAEIRNVSSGGLMAISADPPQRGEYVEFRRETYSIVGRVVWTSGQHFGVQAQQKISLSDLLKPRMRPACESGERRREPRPGQQPAVRRRSAAEHAAAAARQGRAFDFLAVSAIAVSLACLVAVQASELLGSSSRTVVATLRQAALKH